MNWHMFNNFTAALIALGLLMFGVVLGDYYWRDSYEPAVDPIWQTGHGDVQRGRAAIIAHGCGACHTIPGIREARGRVGPQLIRFRDQTYIAGRLPNTPDQLLAWIQNPRDLVPGTAMPNLGVSEAEARDIVTYLYYVSGAQPGSARSDGEADE
ncbi:MAG: c-type cytochrome [Phycisphaeraceae bacterium]